MVALNSGDMLYYDGSEWVNSSTLVSSLTFEVIDNNNTQLAYPIQSRHKLTAGQGLSPGVGMGSGIQFWNEASSGAGTQIGEIDCSQAASSPTASWMSMYLYQGATGKQEVMRVGSTGGGLAVFFNFSLLGNGVPFQLNRLTKGLPTGGGSYSLSAGEYQSPIIEFTPITNPATNIVFPAVAGGLWIIYNNSGATLTLTNTSGGMGTGPTLATGKRAIFYSDGSNMQQITPPQ